MINPCQQTSYNICRVSFYLRIAATSEPDLNVCNLGVEFVVLESCKHLFCLKNNFMRHSEPKWSISEVFNVMYGWYFFNFHFLFSSSQWKLENVFINRGEPLTRGLMASEFRRKSKVFSLRSLVTWGVVETARYWYFSLPCTSLMFTSCLNFIFCFTHSLIYVSNKATNRSINNPAVNHR